MKLESDFALLDVMKGRKALRKWLKKNPQGLKVTVDMVILSPWGSDDGTSIEFECNVTKLRINND